ncbi:MAG: NrfD/PsrC family molybdoenzyme membrane anchor subunit [Alcanivoracaceae bacterium]
MTSIHSDNGAAALQGQSKILQVVAIVLLAIGVTGLYPLVTEGGRAFNQGSALPWGLLVVTYAFLALGSFGVAIVSTVGLLMNQSGMHGLVRRNLMLALGLSIGAVVALALELGHPVRSLWAIPLNMQIRSPLLWMGACWSLYLFGMVVALLWLRAPEGSRQLPGWLTVLILISALGGLFTQGLVYGMMAMRPVWFGSTTPLYFLVGSLPLGLALISLFAQSSVGFRRDLMSPQVRTLIGEQMPKYLLAAMILYSFTWLARVTTGLWTVQDGHHAVFEHMLGSGFFWFELIVGIVLPLVLLVFIRRPSSMISATTALAIIVGLFIARYEFVIGGQLVPLFKGTWEWGLIQYAPSVTEWMVALTGMALAISIYAFGERILYGK